MSNPRVVFSLDRVKFRADEIKVIDPLRPYGGIPARINCHVVRLA